MASVRSDQRAKNCWLYNSWLHGSCCALRKAGAFVQEHHAQATVEMAVVAPVLIVLALIVYNLMQFTCAVARFDRLAPDIVIAQAVSPEGVSGLATTARVQEALQEAMAPYDVQIEVINEADEASGLEILALTAAPQTYRCTLAFHPWPTGFSIAGVNMGTPLVLRHERAVVVDPWRPGVVM